MGANRQNRLIVFSPKYCIVVSRPFFVQFPSRSDVDAVIISRIAMNIPFLEATEHHVSGLYVLVDAVFTHIRNQPKPVGLFWIPSRQTDSACFSLKLFCALDTLSPGRRHPFFSGGSHGDVSLKGVAVHSLSAIVRAPRKRPRDGPRAVAGDAGSQAVCADMSGCSSRASRVTYPYCSSFCSQRLALRPMEMPS